jgi:diguanylate cyclase (GGDEF)-like protein
MSDVDSRLDKLEQLIADGEKWFVPDCARTIALMNEAIELARVLRLPKQEGQALLLDARSHWALGHLAQGHLALDQADLLVPRLKQAQFEAAIANARAELCLAASDYAPALKHWTLCLKKALLVSAFDLYVEACLGVGNIFTAHQQHGDALHWHEVALEFAHQAQDPEQLVECYLHVAADLNYLEQYELTLALTKKSEALFRKSRHKAWLADWYSYQGKAYLSLGQLSAAQACLHQAWEINQQFGYPWSQSLNLLALGKTYVQLQQYSSAAEFLELAHTKIASFESHTLLLQVYEQLTELAKLQGNFQQAWENRRKYHELAIRHAQQLAKEKLTSALERRIRELDTQLMVLQTRQENVMLRQQTTANSELLKTLRSATLQDPLTGVSNRRHLDQELPLLYQRCEEENRPLSVLMVDLDFFKQVNDRFGHAIGDEVICAAALILLQSCRGGDMVARFGGEEFVLLLPGAAGTTAFEVAERIRMRFVRHPWQEVHPELHVTCSIGVAEMGDELSETQLLDHADQALYRAKHQGRNRVELHL